MNNTFTVNGKTYNSLDEMPPDVRAQYESMSNLFGDKNQNGVPDIMENMLNVGTTMMQSNKIIFEGKMYDSVDQLPPEARAKYEQAMSKLADANKNGVPDVLENLPHAGTMFMSTNKILFEGKAYDSVDQLPPEARTKYEQAMSKLTDANKDGVPDILENVLNSTPTITTTEFGVISPKTIIQTGNSNIGPVIVLGILCVILAVGVAILLVLLLGRGGR